MIKETKDKEGTVEINIQRNTCTNNDDLFTSWPLWIIAEDMLALIEGADATK